MEHLYYNQRMLVRKAYKFRLNPNQTQQTALAVQFGHTRFVYNHFLAVRQKFYQENGRGLYYRDTSAQLTALKRQQEYAWLKEADSQVLQQTLKDLDRAFQNFFERRGKCPRFKSKRSRQAIRYPQRVKTDLVAGRTYLPKIGWVKTIFHRPIEGQVKNVTVSKTKSGKFFVSFQVEVEIPEPEYRGEVLGVDLGLETFAALSTGEKITPPRYLAQAERRLKRLQRRLSRKQGGSRGWEEQRLQVARQHEKVANKRADFQHKVSRALVESNRLLCLESLHVKGMVRNHRLAKHITDAAWGQFVRMLTYKGQWYGCRIVQVNRWYPSSKVCSVCGTEMETLPLKVRTWVCPICQAVHDRDVNAARNLKRIALLQIATAGTAGSHAGGEAVSLVSVQVASAKPEALLFAAG